MTMQEAYALAEERGTNLAYRKKIQRIKNTILGALFGGVAGGMAGTGASIANRTTLDGLLNKSLPKGKTIGGAALGATLGGLTGYGLTRLNEKYNESAGMDPTLAGFKIYPALKAASAKARLEKAAQAATLGRLLGTGSASLGRGISWLASNSGKLAARAGRAATNKLNRFTELIGGGKEGVLDDYKLVKENLKDQIARAKATGSPASNIEALERQLEKAEDAFLNGRTTETFTIPTSGGGARTITPTTEMSDELGKIIAARTLAGGGAIGGGYYAMKKYNERKKSLLEKLFG